MQNRDLWAPWRMAYLNSLDDDDGEQPNNETAASYTAHDQNCHQADSTTDTACFLSHYWEHPEDDDAHFVIYRDDFGMIMLNRYPYSGGHLLIALGEGRPRLMAYTPTQRAALWRLVDYATLLTQTALSPQGMNIGINDGKAAGAGIPQHLHVHVVPRWGGDTNFITVVGAVRIVPCALEQMYQRYCDALPHCLI